MERVDGNHFDGCRVEQGMTGRSDRMDPPRDAAHGARNLAALPPESARRPPVREDARDAARGGVKIAALPRTSALRLHQLAWMTLAGGWLAAFTLTAGVANFVRPYRAVRAARGQPR